MAKVIIASFNTVNGKPFPYLPRFTFTSFRYLQYVGLIVALLLCCLTLCGAYRKRQVLLQLYFYFYYWYTTSIVSIP